MFSRKKRRDKRSFKYGLTDALLGLPPRQKVEKVELPKGRKITVEICPDNKDENKVYIFSSSSSSSLDSQCEEKKVPNTKDSRPQENRKGKHRHQRSRADDDEYLESKKSPGSRTLKKDEKSSESRRSRPRRSTMNELSAPQQIPPTLTNSNSCPPIGLVSETSFGSTLSCNSTPIPVIWPSSAMFPAQPFAGFQQAYPQVPQHAVQCCPSQTASMTTGQTHIPFTNSCASQPRSHRSQTTGSIGKLGEQIERVQKEIDRKALELAANPGDANSEFYLKLLREKLSELLNKATAQPPRSSSVPPSPDSITTPGLLAGDATPEPGVVTKDRPKFKHPSSNGVTTEDPVLSRPPAQGQDRKKSRQDKRMIRTKTHHLCSGCGNVRSLNFHDKHPIEPGQPRISNHCESCRATKIKKGVVKGRHFCFGCGKVRSLKFHESHPAVEGDPLFPTYCSACVAEMKSDEEMDDASFVGSSEPEKSSSEKEGNGASFLAPTKEFSDTKESVMMPLVSPLPVEPVTQAPGLHKAATAARPPSPPRKMKRNARAAYDQQPEASTPMSIQIPSYLPERSTRSSKRRSQRSPLTPHAETGEVDYQAPYVEDMDHAIYSHNTKPHDTTCHLADYNHQRDKWPSDQLTKPQGSRMHSPDTLARSFSTDATVNSSDPLASRKDGNENGPSCNSTLYHAHRTVHEPSWWLYENGHPRSNHQDNSSSSGKHRATFPNDDTRNKGKFQNSTRGHLNNSAYYSPGACTFSKLDAHRCKEPRNTRAPDTTPFSPTFARLHYAHKPRKATAPGNCQQKSSIDDNPIAGNHGDEGGRWTYEYDMANDIAQWNAAAENSAKVSATFSKDQERFESQFKTANNDYHDCQAEYEQPKHNPYRVYCPTVQEMIDYVNEFTNSYDFKEKLDRHQEWTPDSEGHNDGFASRLVSEELGVKIEDPNRCTTLVKYVSQEDSSDSDEYDPPEMDDITEAEDLDKLVD